MPDPSNEATTTPAPRCDPWTLLDNWVYKEGLEAAFEDDPLAVVAAYAQDGDGQAATLALEL